jgi:hypothetical protein
MLNVVAELRLVQGVPQVSELASNPDERIRREAIRTLARIGSRGSLGVVMNAANDQSPAVRRTAVRVMGLFGDASAAPFLIDLINGQGMRGKEEDHSVTEAACLALGDLHDPAYVQPLADLLGKGGFFKKGKPDEVRAAAAIALGTIGDPLAVPALEKTAKDQSIMVRTSAERALRRLRGEPTTEPMASDEAAELLLTPGPQERRQPAVVAQSLPFQQPPQPWRPQAPGPGQVTDPSQLPFAPHVIPPQQPPQQQPIPQSAPAQPQTSGGAPPQPDHALPGHTRPSGTPVPPDLAGMWPQGGSLNGHDFPVPPPPEVSIKGPQEAEPQRSQEQAAPPAPAEQTIQDLPDDDYAPGRTDQPSTMERMLGADETPDGEAPPQEPTAPPPAPPQQAPPPDPPPSGWK